ncbi:MAG: deoxyribodipyrimidine photolyase, partial [Deltaproteobacteria bacterium]|nr:deoxyribodipyrimidine photolyase [Deltaproteobacteria bacterium]
MSLRIRTLNDQPVRPTGEYILYWMVMYRRPRWNFALDRAIELGAEHGLPVIVFEPLRCGYQWASDRLHAFILQGMADNREAFEASPVGYYPYVEDQAGAGKGLLSALAERAKLVVTDDYPCFMIPRMQAAAASKIGCAMEAVDSNGLLPIRTTDKEFTRAYSFR